MPYNLIRETWIPVRRASGARERTAPWQLTDRLDDDPITELAAPRPDFDGALIQFLIGLVQTAYAPDTERDWRRGLTDPPEPDVLRAAFAEYEHVFNLDGDGPRFMQDLDAEMEGKEKPISFLLPDTPTSLSRNTDHFIKDRSAEQYSEAATAMALLTMQTNAPSGGRGHRTSLRGGGPLSTLVLGRTLWQTTWLNVLSGAPADVTVDDEAEIFPWLAATRTSEKGSSSRTTTPEDVHALQCYWGMPRRIRLKDAGPKAQCALFGEEAPRTYANFDMKSYGVNYEGAWEHPLSPYRLQKNDANTPLHGRQDGYSYRHWPSMASTTGSVGSVEAAEVVRTFHQRALRYGALDEVFQRPPRLWVFGFDTDRMKVRSWNESTMPLFVISDALRPAFGEATTALIEAAEKAASNLRKTVLWGLYGEPKRDDDSAFWKWELPKQIKNDRKIGQKTVLETADAQFWQDTEPAFYRTLREARDHLENSNPLNPLKTEWADTLRDAALDIFDRITQYGTFRVADPKAVALARSDLRRFTSPGSKTVRKTLGLPEKQTD
jgi:CRISPR system Cascade subunit CasA